MNHAEDEHTINNSRLHKAIFDEDIRLCRQLLEKGADSNAMDDAGVSALSAAVSQGQLEIVKLLIHYGAQLHPLQPLLCFAIWKGHVDIFELLVEKGANIFAEDDFGSMAIHHAVDCMNLEICSRLLDKGVDVNMKKNPLLAMTHVNGFSYKTILLFSRLLLSRGADVNQKNDYGRTALINAATLGDFSLCKLLIEKGADVNVKDHSGSSALGYALKSGNLDLYYYLLEKGATVDKNTEFDQHTYEKTEGISFDYDPYLRKEENIDVDVEDLSNDSPLLTAVYDGDLNACRLLVEIGYQIKSRTKNRRKAGMHPTLLHIAATNLYYKVCQFLIKKGADLNARNYNNETPLHELLKVNAEYVADKYTPIRKESQQKICKLLIEKGTHLNTIDKDGNTPLYEAVNKRYLDICQLMIENGADVNAKNSRGTSILAGYVSNLGLFYSDRQEMVRLLIKAGADVNTTDLYGKSPLHYFAAMGYPDMCRLLLEKGADINANSAFGVQTPLFEAVANEQLTTCELLLEQGADVGIRDHVGRTVLDVALENNSVQVVQLLSCNHSLKQR